MYIIMIMQFLLFMDSYCVPEMVTYFTFNPHNTTGLVLLPHFTQGNSEAQMD